jgi:hypothetical protein
MDYRSFVALYFCSFLLYIGVVFTLRRRKKLFLLRVFRLLFWMGVVAAIVIPAIVADRKIQSTNSLQNQRDREGQATQ